MKNLLYYYYGISPMYIYNEEENYYFSINQIKYVFAPVVNKNINLLVDLSNFLYNKNIMVHTFIINKENNYIVNYNNINYALLRVNCNDSKKIKLKDIIEFNNILVNSNSRNYIELWSNEVDDIEEEIIDFNKEYELITDTINYYIGLCENAIEYYKDNVNNENVSVSINHLNINYNMTFLDFFNPLNFIIDYRVRDISEYIKSIFFNTLDEERILNIINKLNINKDEASIIFSRLLYPNYYFKMYNEILNNKVKEEHLNKIIKLSKEYENLLNNIQQIFKKKYNLPIIDWLI